MLRKLNKIAQSTAEYAIIIAVVVGAVIAMQVYVKRGLQGRVKNVVDWTGGNWVNADAGVSSADIFSGRQYEPDYSQSNMDMQSSAQRQESMQAGGGVTRNIIGEASTSTGVRKTTGTPGTGST